MEQYKDFITKLQDKDEEVEVRKTEMREEEKKDFLRQHQINDNDEDDQIMFSFNKTTQVLERLKCKKECKELRKKMGKEEWEALFQTMLDNYLINVNNPEQFYEEKITLKDTKDLDDKFEELEEQNLTLIGVISEYGMSLEELWKEQQRQEEKYLS